MSHLAGRRVVVVGAGLAGVGAAAELRGAGVEVVVVERDTVVGGRIRTVELDGEPVDLGAQFLATFSRRVLEAARAAGLGGAMQLRPQRASVVHEGISWPVDEALTLVRSHLLSPRGRARLPLLVLPVLAAWRRLDPDDLALAAPLDDRPADELVRRWAGAEVAERFVEPVLRGLLYWDLATTSQALLLVMLRTALRSRDVVRLDGGTARFATALAAGLDVRLGRAATNIGPGPDGSWFVETVGGEPLEADGVVCATTAPVAARLVPGGATASFLRTVTYSRTAVVTCRLAEGATPPRGTQLFTTGSAPLLASVNPPPSAPGAGRPVFVRIFLSDAGVEAVGHLDDERVAAAALGAVRAAGGDAGWTTGATPVHVWRWDEALPRFCVGALRAVGVRDPGSLDIGSLVLAGDYLGGPFLEGALVSGRAAARRLLARL